MTGRTRTYLKKGYLIIIPYHTPINEAKLRLYGNVGQIIPLKFNKLNEDFSKGRITARISNIATSRGEELNNQIQNLSKEIFGEKVDILVTGSTLLALKTNRYLVKNLTVSFLIAFTIIVVLATSAKVPIWGNPLGP